MEFNERARQYLASGFDDTIVVHVRLQAIRMGQVAVPGLACFLPSERIVSLPAAAEVNAQPAKPNGAPATPAGSNGTPPPAVPAR